VTVVDEHLATRRAAGLFDFSFMGLYEFERAVPAQTRELDALEPGQIAYTLILKEDGAVRIDATVWRLDQTRYWLFAGKRAAYGGRDRSGEYAILALQGPSSGWILARLIGPDAVARLRYWHFLEKDGLIVARIGYSGELGYELLVPAAEAAALRSRLLQAGQAEGLRECTWPAADSLRIEAGYVLFDFKSGATGLFDGNRLNDHAAANPRRTMGEMWLEGERGVLRLDGDARLWWKAHQKPEAEHRYDRGPDDAFGGGCCAALQSHVVNHFLSKSPLENTGKAYLANLRIEEAVYRSSAEGRRIAIS